MPGNVLKDFCSLSHLRLMILWDRCYIQLKKTAEELRRLGNLPKIIKQFGKARVHF